MWRHHYVPLWRCCNIPIRCRGEIPLRRLAYIPLRLCWVFHLRCTCDVVGMYRETSLRRCQDVQLPNGDDFKILSKIQIITFKINLRKKMVISINLQGIIFSLVFDKTVRILLNSVWKIIIFGAYVLHFYDGVKEPHLNRNLVSKTRPISQKILLTLSSSSNSETC